MLGICDLVRMPKKIFNIRIKRAEIFIAVLIIVLLARSFFYQNIYDVIFNISVLFLVAGFSILFVVSAKEDARDHDVITDLNKKLEDSNAELKKLDEAKSEFISIASHQLRAPMTAIKGYVSLLSEGTFGKLSAGQMEALHKIFILCERIVVLIDDLLNLSRIESGKMWYDFENADLIKIAKDVVTEFSPQIEKKKLDLVMNDKFTGTMPEVMADPDKIRQVFINLINNAVQYTDKGGVEINFYKRTENNVDYAGVEVRDTGRGIDASDLDRIFVKFVRGERTRKSYTEGSGLGLYVAKKIVEDHKGKIYVKSDGPEKGSCFFVEIPVAK